LQSGACAMEFRTILVNLDVDYYSPNILKVAVDLAQRFGARLSAVAAASPPASFLSAESAAITLDLYEAERTQLADRLRRLEAAFIEAVPTTLRGDCLTALETPNAVLSRLARHADLLLLRSHLGGEEVYSRNVDVGGLLLAAGRPVLLIQPDGYEVKADRIVVGWKDSREARRAVSDALPLLKRAKQVVVAEVEGGGPSTRAGVDDVVSWLLLHDVEAHGQVYPATGSHCAALQEIASENGADLIVAGAFGQSRLREWIFGGVTRDLLASPAINRFMSN